MRDACRVEVYSAEGGGKHFMTLPERIWQRGDLLLAAAGSLACVRALYLRAAELGKLHQFLPCPLTRADYAAGQAAEHLAARLREAARRPGVGGVVLYASCAEVLTQCDLEQVAEQAGLPVRILLRGPLVARTRNAVAELEQILSTFPPPVGEIPRGSAPLPVLPPDFSGVASLLQSWDAYPFLLTAGGCTGCLTLGDDATAGLRLEHSRFDDLELAAGCEAAAVNGIARGFAHSGRAFCGLMGSAIPELLGMDYTGIQESLAERGVPVLRFPCTGFESAPVGVDRALRNLATWRRPEGRDNQRISILGYSDLALGSRQPLRLGAEALTTRGYQVGVWGEEGFGGGELRSAPALNWVVTAEGLGAARQMEADYGIPYFCGLPLERYGLERWLSRFSTAAKGAPPEKPVEHETGNRTLLLIGAPIATEGLAWAIRGEYPNCPLPDFKGALPALSHRRYASVWRSGGAGRLGDARCPAGRSPLFPLPAAVVSTGGASGLSRARSVRQGWTARTVAGGCGVCDVGYWKKSYLVMEKCTSPGGCRMAADVLYCNHKVQYRKGIGAFHGNR